jgi:prepilin-type N-terminal cleavage/methylation domain-containing protein
MNKLLKNNKGFTLVEVIVVAVIVLILAAVAIPLYQGYITDSRQSAVENAAGSIASALGAGISTGSLVRTAGAPTGATISLASATTAGSIVFASGAAAGGDVSITIPKNMVVGIAGCVVTVDAGVPAYTDGRKAQGTSTFCVDP